MTIRLELDIRTETEIEIEIELINAINREKKEISRHRGRGRYNITPPCHRVGPYISSGGYIWGKSPKNARGSICVRM